MGREIQSLDDYNSQGQASHESRILSGRQLGGRTQCFQVSFAAFQVKLTGSCVRIRVAASYLTWHSAMEGTA